VGRGLEPQRLRPSSFEGIGGNPLHLHRLLDGEDKADGGSLQWRISLRTVRRPGGRWRLWERRVGGVGVVGSQMRGGWPCPTSALAVAAREIGLGLRRFIPARGSTDPPGAMWERATSVSIGGADARAGIKVRRPARVRRGRGTPGGELACDGEGGALTTAAAFDFEVEVVVGAAGLAGVVGASASAQRSSGEPCLESRPRRRTPADSATTGRGR
jgi:hypothetical protein